MFVITTIMLSFVVLIAYLKKIKKTEGMSSGTSQGNSGDAVFHNSSNSADQPAKYSALGNDQQPSKKQYSLIQGREGKHTTKTTSPRKPKLQNSRLKFKIWKKVLRDTLPS